MPRIKDSSLDVLNKTLDAEHVLSLLDATCIHHCGTELRAFCPIHGSDKQRSLAVHLQENLCMCHNTGCPAHEGGTLLWLWALKHTVSIREAAEFWARKTGFRLEYEAERPQPEEFIFKEVAGISANRRFWRNRLVASTQSITDLQPHSYQSVFCYQISDMQMLRNKLRDRQAYVYGPLFCDFDNPFPDSGNQALLKSTPFEGITCFEQGVRCAQKDAVRAAEYLVQHGVDVEALSLYFSGRGFHIEAAPGVFGAQPSTDLHCIYQELAFLIAGIDRKRGKIPLEFNSQGRASKCAFPAQLQTLDQNIYNADRLWRVPNTFNTKSARYKIPLTLDELRNLSAGDILHLAQNPRHLPSGNTVFKASRDARHLFIRAWRALKRGQRSQLVLPEKRLEQLGYRVVYVNQNGKAVRGHLSQDVAGAAAELARTAHCPVVLAVKA